MSQTMQPMVDNKVPSDSMPDMSVASDSLHYSGAQNNHGYDIVGNGVGGRIATHELHASKVPLRDDMTPKGDDTTSYGAT